MKHMISILALLALPACLDSGDTTVDVDLDDTVEEDTVDDVDLTPDTPDLALNTEVGTLLNDARTTFGSADVTYDSSLGRAAQDHANDMFDNDYLAVTIPGTVGNNNGMQDIGDRVTAYGYTWADIVQLVAQGDFTTSEAFDELNNDGNCGGPAQDLCITDSVLENFGLAKAGSGDDQRWVLVLTSPG